MGYKHINDKEWSEVRKSFLFRGGKGYRKIKNLGWLLRNWQKIIEIQVDSDFAPSLKAQGYECRLIAYFDNGFYQTLFMSKEICRNWLNRPVFKGLKLSWFRENTTC